MELKTQKAKTRLFVMIPLLPQKTQASLYRRHGYVTACRRWKRRKERIRTRAAIIRKRGGTPFIISGIHGITCVELVMRLDMAEK